MTPNQENKRRIVLLKQAISLLQEHPIKKEVRIFEIRQKIKEMESSK